jgi:hypothetical protein
MLKTEVLIAFLFLTRLYEFFEGGNEPVFGGRQFTQRIDRHATIGGKKLPALPMLQILDVGESSVSQLFR